MRALMLGLLLSGAWLGAPTRTAAYSVQEAILRVQPEIEEGLRLAAAGALAGATLEAQPQITVMLSNGIKLEAKVQKFSAPPTVDSTGKPTPDSGRDLALLRVQDGVYPAIGLTTREVQIGDPV